MAVIILSKKFSNFKGVAILYRISNEKKKGKKKIRGRDYNRAPRNDDAIYESRNTDVLSTSDPVRSFNPSEIATYD